MAHAHGRIVAVLEPTALYHRRDLFDLGDEQWTSDWPGPASIALPGQVGLAGPDEADVVLVTAGNGVPLSIVVFDVDHFKRVNDTHGHPAGDEVIREVGVRADDSLRTRDFVGRIGGEEFAIILPKADIEGAKTVCERLRLAIDGKPVRHRDAIIPFTISVGVTEFQSGDDIDHIMARADEALYEAKTGGRNQVRVAA